MRHNRYLYLVEILLGGDLIRYRAAAYIRPAVVTP